MEISLEKLYVDMLPWVPEDIFFLSILIVCGEAASTRREAPIEKNSPSREPYQTVSTVYFILGISRMDLWSQGIDMRALRGKCHALYSFHL